MKRASLYLLFFSLLASILFVTGFAVPREVFCIDDACSEIISSGELLKAIKVDDHLLPSKSPVQVYAKGAKGSTEWKVKVGELIFYVDSSSIVESNVLSADNIRLVSNPDHIVISNNTSTNVPTEQADATAPTSYKDKVEVDHTRISSNSKSEQTASNTTTEHIQSTVSSSGPNPVAGDKPRESEQVLNAKNEEKLEIHSPAPSTTTDIPKQVEPMAAKLHEAIEAPVQPAAPSNDQTKPIEQYPTITDTKTDFVPQDQAQKAPLDDQAAYTQKPSEAKVESPSSTEISASELPPASATTPSTEEAEAAVLSESSAKVADHAQVNEANRPESETPKPSFETTVPLSSELVHPETPVTPMQSTGRTAPSLENTASPPAQEDGLQQDTQAPPAAPMQSAGDAVTVSDSTVTPMSPSSGLEDGLQQDTQAPPAAPMQSAGDTVTVSDSTVTPMSPSGLEDGLQQDTPAPSAAPMQSMTESLVSESPMQESTITPVPTESVKDLQTQMPEEVDQQKSVPQINESLLQPRVQGVAHCLTWAAKMSPERDRSPLAALVLRASEFNLRLAGQVLAWTPQFMLGPWRWLVFDALRLELDAATAWLLFVVQCIFARWLLRLFTGLLLDTDDIRRTKGSQAETLALHHRLRELTTGLARREAEMADLQRDTDRLKQECHHLRDKTAHDNQPINGLTEALREAEQRLQFAEQQREALADQLKAAEQEAAAHLALQNAEAQNHAKALEQKLIEHQQRQDKQDEENRKLYDQANDYYRRMGQLQAEMNEYAKNNESLTRKLTAKEAELQSMCDSIMQLQQAKSSTSSRPTNRRRKTKKPVKRIEYREEEVETEEEVEVTDDEAPPPPESKESAEQDDNDSEGWGDADFELDVDEEAPRKTKIIRRKVMKRVQVPVEILEEVSGEENDAEEAEQSDEEEEEEEETRRQRLMEVFDANRLRSQLSSAEEKTHNIQVQLRRELELREDLEKRILDLEASAMESQTQCQHANSERDQALNRLEILSDYFNKRQLELQQDLTKRSRQDSGSASELQSYREKFQLLDTELKVSKELAENLKKELANSERVSRRQLTELDKRAHDNWLALRRTESLVKELREENAVLRQRLQELSHPASSRVANGKSASNRRNGPAGQHARQLIPPPPPPPPPPPMMMMSGGSPFGIMSPTQISSNGNRSYSRHSGSNRSDNSGPANRIPPPPFLFPGGKLPSEIFNHMNGAPAMTPSQPSASSRRNKH